MGAVPASGPSYMEHCYAWHLPPPGADLILVEYAVNFDGQEDFASFERLIRRLLRLPNHPAIVIVNVAGERPRAAQSSTRARVRARGRLAHGCGWVRRDLRVRHPCACKLLAQRVRVRACVCVRVARRARPAKRALAMGARHRLALSLIHISEPTRPY